MRSVILILAFVSLQGCFYQTANSYDIKRAIAFCGSVENIHEITVIAIGDETVLCFDGRKEML